MAVGANDNVKSRAPASVTEPNMKAVTKKMVEHRLPGLDVSISQNPIFSDHYSLA